jgi:hypothetical protein
MEILEITDQDIRRAEALFFPEGGSFADQNNERYRFIKYLDRSIRLQACPGSGKTTALLAKLYLLSEKMPFENNRGICCLTHTNVAIDIIKKRLGDKADRLFHYPNFFGTIQSFVDRYLAIPAFIRIFGPRPKYVNDEIVESKLSRFKRELDGNGWIRLQMGKKGQENSVEFVINEIKLSFDDNNKIIFKGKNGKNLLKDEKSTAYAIIKEIRVEKILKEGYLTYDDAYSLANAYIRDYSEMLRSAFSSRFKFVFVDEAQDTLKTQVDIIKSLFDHSVIIQWIGDVNQAIFNDSDDMAEVWKPQKISKLEVKDSRRISQPIADLVKTVAVDPYDELRGTNVDIKPIIILYNAQNITNVLERFVEIVSERNLDKVATESGNPIKAVGWVGKSGSKLSIKNYFPEYNKLTTIKRKPYFKNLYTMLCYAPSLSPKEFMDSYLDCILEVLYLSGIKNGEKYHSKSSFVRLLKDKDEKFLLKFRSKLAKWYVEIRNNKLNNNDMDGVNKIFKCISSFSLDLLANQLRLEINQQSRTYLSQKIVNGISPQQVRNKNIYRSGKYSNIEVEVGTVHSVKGETHTATLYLETMYYGKRCCEYLIDKMIGGQNKKIGVHESRALRIAYVAFSRPTHLLCIAFDKANNCEDKLRRSNKIEVINLQ